MNYNPGYSYTMHVPSLSDFGFLGDLAIYLGGLFYVVLFIYGLFMIVTIIPFFIGASKIMNLEGYRFGLCWIPFYGVVHFSKATYSAAGMRDQGGLCIAFSVMSMIPFVNFLGLPGLLIMLEIANFKICKRFGKKTGFCILSLIFPTITYIILGSEAEKILTQRKQTY